MISCWLQKNNVNFIAGAVIDFDSDDTDLGTIAEGQFFVLGVEGTGFSYGNIQVLLTPLPCSDYPGNLSALFNNVPDASASPGMSLRTQPKQCSFLLFVFR